MMSPLTPSPPPSPPPHLSLPYQLHSINTSTFQSACQSVSYAVVPVALIVVNATDTSPTTLTTTIIASAGGVSDSDGDATITATTITTITVTAGEKVVTCVCQEADTDRLSDSQK